MDFNCLLKTMRVFKHFTWSCINTPPIAIYGATATTVYDRFGSKNYIGLVEHTKHPLEIEIICTSMAPFTKVCPSWLDLLENLPYMQSFV